MLVDERWEGAKFRRVTRVGVKFESSKGWKEREKERVSEREKTRESIARRDETRRTLDVLALER